MTPAQALAIARLRLGELRTVAATPAAQEIRDAIDELERLSADIHTGVIVYNGGERI